MKLLSIPLLLLIGLSAFSQSKLSTENILFDIHTDSLYSDALKDYRTIKVYLPEAYSEKKKYPVLYVLDAQWMFEPTVLESKILSGFDVIPPCIVVGIFHKNRNRDIGINWRNGAFTGNSQKFYSFLVSELIPQIDTRYKTSGFNTLVGHSNSATYCHEVIYQKEQPFQGFIALSQNVFGHQLDTYASFVTQYKSDPLFYYVASGKRDATPRLETGIKLDSVFRKRKNPKIFSKHTIYDADHNGIVGKGLNAGISHTFSMYTHYNDWNETLLDSLVAQKADPIEFIKQHAKKIERMYGISFEINQDDLSFIQAMAQTVEEIERIQQFEIKHFGKSEHFYASYAQFYEYIQSYDKALAFWNKNLEGAYAHNENFFYYRRPVELLFQKTTQPEKALAFIKKWRRQKPEHRLYFDFLTAKIALRHPAYKKQGLSAINRCIENFKENNWFDLQKAKEIRQQLTG